MLSTHCIVGLYPNVPYEEGLRFLKKAIDKQQKTVSTESLIYLTELVLKYNYFGFNNSFRK